MSLSYILARMIATDGPMPLDRFMTLCAAHPEHGYYMQGEPIGARGAFTTAPEISQMFGELIGVWCHAMWEALGAPPKFYLVELGPGNGTLFADALRAARQAPQFLAAAQGVLIDSSPLLIARQRAVLAKAAIPIQWATEIGAIPQDAPVLIVANEFFDALPVRQAVKGPRGWHERLVGHGKALGEFAFGLSPQFLSPELIPPLLHDAPEHSVVEFSPARAAVARDIAVRISQSGGAALVIDYGYEGPKLGETYQALARHQSVDPLSAPGGADVTAHVDFAALRTACLGAAVRGPIHQGDFLRRIGIVERAGQLKRHATPRQAQDIDAALARLTGSAAMGALFKVLMICHDSTIVPPGFSP